MGVIDDCFCGFLSSLENWQGNHENIPPIVCPQSQDEDVGYEAKEMKEKHPTDKGEKTWPIDRQSHELFFLLLLLKKRK